MTTLATIARAHVVYSVSVQWCKDGPFFIGSCPFDRLHKLPDARRNSEWLRLIDPDHDRLSVAILAILPTADEAAAVATASALAAGAWANRAAVPPEPVKRRVRCLTTGMVYDSAAAAGRAHGITRQAVAQMINAGTRFERVT